MKIQHKFIIQHKRKEKKKKQTPKRGRCNGTNVPCEAPPLVADALDSLAGASVCSVLDLKSVFWQIQVQKDSQQMTAFSTHNGLYEFLTMQFGLVNSGASFQRLMGHILRGLEYRFALIYTDDIIIFSKSVDEHLDHLEEVFRRLPTSSPGLFP